MRQDTPELRWTYSISLTGYNLVPGVGLCWIMDRTPVELNAILREIERALDAKLYYLPIAVAFSVPDVCSGLELNPENPGRQNRRTYVAWCEANLCQRFQDLNGHDIYNLRGGTLHKGRFEHHEARFNRVVFVGPESPFRVHDSIISIAPDVKFGGGSMEEMTAEALRLSEKALILGVLPFCQAVIESAREWVIRNLDTANVKANLPRLVRYRPEGLPPFMVNVPVISCGET
jgi:hypothetical protein